MQIYDDNYFTEYKKRASTDMGRQLTEERRRLVEKFYDDVLVDVGIGAGQFIESRSNDAPTYGFDIALPAIKWLMERKLWHHPYKRLTEAISCWDSLEHIPDAAELVGKVKYWIFCSLPIFRDSEHVLSSKHFKPNEHCWYWTDWGLVGWMDRLGFDCVERSDIESQLGREDIETFVFKRK